MAYESEPTGTRKTQRTEFSRRDPQIAGCLLAASRSRANRQAAVAGNSRIIARRRTALYRKPDRAGLAAVFARSLAALFGAACGEGRRDERRGREPLQLGSIYPPSAKSMTVATASSAGGERSSISRRRPQCADPDHGGGPRSAAAERAAVQKAVVWFDRRMGARSSAPTSGWRRRISATSTKAQLRLLDTTRNTTSLLLVLQEWGLLKHHAIGTRNIVAIRWCADAAQHGSAGRSRHQGRMGRDLWPRGYLAPPARD